MIIAIYNHEYGNTVKAFSNIESANKWKDKIATDYWVDDVFGENVNPPDTNIGDAYFMLMIDYIGYNESFEIIENITIES